MKQVRLIPYTDSKRLALFNAMAVGVTSRMIWFGYLNLENNK